MHPSAATRAIVDRSPAVSIRIGRPSSSAQM
jgi:hypothetical protein